jgi:hypothetical protein
MTIRAEDLGARLAAVRERIAAAARRAGRDPGEVLLVGASKEVPAEAIAAAAALGLTDVGENRVQEMLAKQEALATDPASGRLRWHFIGALQRNKAKAVAGRVALVHGVDSPGLARALAARARATGITQDVLLEVNTSGEPAKHGVPLERVEAAALEVAALAGLRLRGLMTVGPLVGDPEDARPSFVALRAARDRAARIVPGLAELSMGMSADVEIAVEEGATIVRVGTAIFGPRPGGG